MIFETFLNGSFPQVHLDESHAPVITHQTFRRTLPHHGKIPACGFLQGSTHP